jgi:hypothetical protein
MNKDHHQYTSDHLLQLQPKKEPIHNTRTSFVSTCTPEILTCAVDQIAFLYDNSAKESYVSDNILEDDFSMLFP